jgi:hypothetical protein
MTKAYFVCTHGWLYESVRVCCAFVVLSVLAIEMCEMVLEQLSNLRHLDRYSESGAPCVNVPRILHEALLTELFDKKCFEGSPLLQQHLVQLVTAVCDGMHDGLQVRRDPLVSATAGIRVASVRYAFAYWCSILVLHGRCPCALL